MTGTSTAAALRSARFPLLALPRPALTYILLVEALTVAAVVAAPAEVTAHQLGLAALLVAVCLVQHEAALSAERGYRRATIRRERSSDTGHLVTNSVYTVTAALLFPPVLVAGVVAAIYGYRILRIDRPRLPRERGPVFRTVFTAATVTLAGTAAGHTAQLLGLDLTQGAASVVPIVAVLATIVVYTAVQAGLVAGIVASVASPLAARAMFTDLRQHGFEISQLCIGATLAFLLVSPSPWLAVLLIPTLWLLTKVVLVSTVGMGDDEGGLLSPGAWHRGAAGELQRARRRGTPFGILAVDLDDFRRINEECGVQGGDHVLDEVVRRLSAVVRDGDLVGRMDGEEFVIAASAADPTDLRTLADRITTAIQELDLSAALAVEHSAAPTLTACVGAAAWPGSGDTVDSLLTRADDELQAAKAAGRGVVRIATTTVTTEAAATAARTGR
ncbi:hypothetical protein GCM10009613_26830 [Pseudonocardia kongjuensis]|uniref:GGDEF domain-containing protein n=1 Tax=Pseudonocardia kongjuensis TaxID=102227 RepID=A0ABN1XSU6_9PSEU